MDDVDAHYERLRAHVSEWGQTPTTMPWANRSLLLRDPDGNPVNLHPPRRDRHVLVRPPAATRWSR